MSFFAIVFFARLWAGPMDPLFQWKFDEEGGVCKDSSGNSLDGKTKSEWIKDGANGIRFMNGKTESVISLVLPEGQRVGRGSWSFSIWVKPFQNSIEDRQNQRRILSIGKYPDANLVLNINANGTLGSYFCYKNESGKITATGANCDQACPTNVWTHLVLVCDRNARKTRFFINGQPAGENDISADFKGDYTFREMTVGSEWHNYWGALDEVRFDLRARSGEEIKKEFRDSRARFGVSETQAASGGLVEEILEAVDAAKISKNNAALRTLCAKASDNKEMSSSLRSYAHLRLAQSFAEEGTVSSAKTEYEKIKNDASYPAVHRYEAESTLAEMERTVKGLSPRDPAASRVKVNEVSSFASEIFVAPTGRDEGAGSSKEPLRSLEAARDKVREIRKNKKGAVLVHIADGVYTRNKTFEL
ncbi:MAG: LamG domain-containing protein, partial [Spirochaetia bacterium]|nr:LamG domain-containing protein [Spirochaetia bacterium]